MREQWRHIADLMRRLSWCVILTGVVAVDGVPVLLVPAALVAADALRRLAPLLDRPAARRDVERAAIAAGGVATAGVLTFPASSRDLAGAVAFVALSVAMSLYAVGLASWTSRIGDGVVARRLRRSVALWWGALVVATLGYATGNDVDSDTARSGWSLVSDDVTRAISPIWGWASFAVAVAAMVTLTWSHAVIRGSLDDLAATGGEVSAAPA